MRMTVVFPAPSGPTRPNISPSRTARSRERTASTASNDRPRAWVSTARALMVRSRQRRRRDADRRVGGQARLEQALAVLDHDLDPEDELDPVLLSLDVLGREFGLRGDVSDPAG